MVEGFILIAKGTNKCEIDLGSAHIRNFFRSMEIDFLNQAVKLVNVILHADGRIFTEHEESSFSHISKMWPSSSSKRDQIFAALVILNTFVLSTFLRHFNNTSIARVFLSSQLS